MEFIETSLFSKLIREYFSDEEYSALQWLLLAQPDAGDLIPGSGGLRKLRWAAPGRGKSSGYRVIYYWRDHKRQIWLLTIYAKSEATNIPAHVLKAIKKEIDDDKA
ncbi:MAG TPA: type II toxin-antitoxin system RelE/ParE family toxin [Candidatus Ozemobacteraceae bacterium]|nr:type II toxin-antitoxin system RelE/ParE family toxin [Candidatus Ozemobacteraceae bacterium]HQG27102.1 type II toxin-antitoxin system RelE/ParE family toxin [Candidatus Ozemobacteraceae bacterium]